MTRQTVVDFLATHSAEIRRDFGVRDLAIFGSVARDEARPDSDLDLLVGFDGPPTFDRFMNLRFFLEDRLGRTVDLVTDAALRPELRPAIEREAIRVP